MSHSLTTGDIAILAGLELIGAVLAVRLWTRKSQASLLVRIAWTAVLLVPLVGMLAYGLLRLNPDEHGEELPTRDEEPSAGHGGADAD